MPPIMNILFTCHSRGGLKPISIIMAISYIDQEKGQPFNMLGKAHEGRPRISNINFIRGREGEFYIKYCTTGLRKDMWAR